ncbi:MAG TPA: PIG-L family deacetylase [Nocardioidaceae bacterium]|nr:PIG-L family deacetylase [Nocardioidaceae bacterium]
MLSFRRVLAVGAHTDDIELGCGALLSRLHREDAEIRVAVFSRAEQSLPAGVPEDTLEIEFRKAMGHLGVDTDAIHMGTVPVRHFPAHRQSVLEDLVALNRSFDPDLVLTMSSTDTHQDHEVVHAESVRASRGRTVLGYDTPWNQRVTHTTMFAEVTQADVDTKVAMMAEYRSQATLGRGYVDEEFVRSAARFRGVQGKCGLAEAFEVVTMSWPCDG